MVKFLAKRVLLQIDLIYVVRLVRVLANRTPTKLCWETLCFLGRGIATPGFPLPSCLDHKPEAWGCSSHVVLWGNKYEDKGQGADFEQSLSPCWHSQVATLAPGVSSCFLPPSKVMTSARFNFRLSVDKYYIYKSQYACVNITETAYPV